MQMLDKLQLSPWDWMPSGRQDAVGKLPNRFSHLFSAAPRLVYNMSWRTKNRDNWDICFKKHCELKY